MNHIKTKIINWLLKDEKKKLQELIRIAENGRIKYRRWVETRTVTDMCREKLAGFDFKENQRDLINSIPKDELENYLSQAKSICGENKVFGFVVDYMIRKQVEAYSNEAINIEKINFGRATLNGIALIEEAMELLESEHASINGDDDEIEDKYSSL